MKSDLFLRPRSRVYVSVWLVSICLGLMAFLPGPVGAQTTTSTCPNGSLIRIDSGQRLDIPALCEATEPWASQGIRVVIYLTNFASENENDWYDHLDQVEVDMGLISPNRAIDNFDPQVLALEASTAVNAPYATTITLGRDLFDTPIDQEENLDQIKAMLHQSLRREAYTDGFITALDDLYKLTYPPSPSSQLPSLFAILAIVGLVLFLLIRFSGHIGRAFKKGRRQLALRQHRSRLRAPLANNLALFDALLTADTPKASLVYRLFFAQGGDKYETMQKTAVNLITQAQTTLQTTKQAWQQLPSTQQMTLEQQVRQLEQLYQQLLGTTVPNPDLTDDLLHQQLAPLWEKAPNSFQDEKATLRSLLRAQLTIPLFFPPADPPVIGILDHVEAVKALIVTLSAAADQAKPALEALQRRKQRRMDNLPDDFVLSAAELFGPVANQEADAQAALADGRYLDVMATIAQINTGLDTIDRFTAVITQYQARTHQIMTANSAGYRPPTLFNLENELSLSLRPIQEAYRRGNYDEGLALLDEFDVDSQHAVEEIEAWQQLHQANQAGLQQAEETLNRLIAYQSEKCQPAWDALQQYTAGNWQDIAHYPAEAAQTLADIQQNQIPACKRLNEMTQPTQQFDAAAASLSVITAALSQAEFRLESVVHRHQEVDAAAATLQAALQITQTDLAEVIALRDAEDAKIGPEVDELLHQAETELTTAQSHIHEQNYRPAIVTQNRVRQLARQARATAVAEIDRLNTLLQKLETSQNFVDKYAPQTIAAAQEMPAVMQTETSNQAAKECEAQWSVAQILATQTAGLEDQAWADALEQAVIAYQTAEKAVKKSQTANATARREYVQLENKAKRAMRDAEAAVRAAERARQRSGVGSAGNHALDKAKSALPGAAIAGATREMLQRIAREAHLAGEHARLAETQAKDAARRYKNSRRHDNDSSWTFSSGSSSSQSSWSGSRSSRSSSSRSSSRSGGSTSSRRRH